jgi:hypothetical protein
MQAAGVYVESIGAQPPQTNALQKFPAEHLGGEDVKRSIGYLRYKEKPRGVLWSAHTQDQIDPPANRRSFDITAGFPRRSSRKTLPSTINRTSSPSLELFRALPPSLR